MRRTGRLYWLTSSIPFRRTIPLLLAISRQWREPWSVTSGLLKICYPWCRMPRRMVWIWQSVLRIVIWSIRNCYLTVKLWIIWIRECLIWRHISWHPRQLRCRGQVNIRWDLRLILSVIPISFWMRASEIRMQGSG
mgnify:CR=1 FL=1